MSTIYMCDVAIVCFVCFLDCSERCCLGDPEPRPVTSLMKQHCIKVRRADGEARRNRGYLDEAAQESVFGQNLPFVQIPEIGISGT